MNGITMDSTKLLTEKLAIARELAILKPELEHLRSQTSYQQTVLSEKLALQRQVSTLEVELEAEKRASKRVSQKNNIEERESELQQQIEELQKDLTRVKREGEKALKDAEKELEAEKRASKRTAQKNSNSIEKEAEFQQQLEGLQKDLAREKREGEKASKETEKELKASEIRQTVLESKLDQMRTKLRATKEQLKECQTELSQARAAVVKAESAKIAPARNPRKRGACEMSTDEAIGTPDGVAARGKRPAAKRGRMDQTMVGEKSMFSITPFLNRTVNIAPDIHAKDSNQEVKEDEDQTVEKASASETPNHRPSDPLVDVSSPTVMPQAKNKKKAAEKLSTAERNILGEAKAGSKNKKPPQKKPRALSTLEKVTEEEIEDNEQPQEAPASKPEVQNEPDAIKTANLKPPKVQIKNGDDEDAGQKKKKRKLLGGGKTLFDEEDGEATKRPTKLTLGPPRLMGKGGLVGLKGGLRGGLSAAGALGAFSPLKKDRRGIGASFLA
jgi:hypothetical protein